MSRESGRTIFDYILSFICPTRTFIRQSQADTIKTFRHQKAMISLEQFPLQSQIHNPIVMTSGCFISNQVEALSVKHTLRGTFGGYRKIKNGQGDVKFQHLTTNRSKNFGAVYDVVDSQGQLIYSIESASRTSYSQRFLHGDRELATSQGHVLGMRMASPYFPGMNLHMSSFNYDRVSVLFNGDPMSGGVPIA